MSRAECPQRVEGGHKLGQSSLFYEGYMNPPWIEHPDIEQGMGWRMGFGATYNYEFAVWFSALTAIDQESLVTHFPEPPEWEGYYGNIIENPLPYCPE